MNNVERADSVAEFIDAFSKSVGNQDEDHVTRAGDMICNILHWVHQSSDREDPRKDPFIAARMGIAHYVSEASIDYEAEVIDELGPDAIVTIDVFCDSTSYVSITGCEPQIMTIESEANAGGMN